MIASSIAGILKKKSSIAIMSHVMPDGDSIGSMLTLFNVLKSLGKKVDVYSSDAAPETFSFLPGYDFIKYCDDITDDIYEVTAVLDCGSLERTGKCSKIAEKSGVTINIDHHGTNSLFADLNLVDTNASSTGELIYQIIKLMGVDISKDEGACLYTAILTDTGGFRYSNTTSMTHEITGDLINTGIDFGRIHELIYNNYKYQDIKLMGRVLSNIELICNGRASYIQLLKNDIKDMDLENLNTSDFINYARDINGVEAAIFVKEVEEGEYKVSFRSKHIVDVKKICEKYNGGGHIRAAGCTITGSLPEVKQSIINDLEKALKDDNV